MRINCPIAYRGYIEIVNTRGFAIPPKALGIGAPLNPVGATKSNAGVFWEVGIS